MNKDYDEQISKSKYLEAVASFGLTRKETELGYLKVSGFSNQRIADIMGISVLTVKKHFTHIYEKAWVPGKKEFIELIKKKK